MSSDNNGNYEELLEWFKRLFNSIQAGILVIDAESKIITEANPAAALMIGSVREEIIDTKCTSYPCFKNNSCVSCLNIPCPIANLNLDIEDEEAVITRKDGSKLNLLVTVNKMRCHNKKFLVKSFVNITSLKDSGQDWQEAEKILSENMIKLKDIHQSHSFKVSEHKENLYKALDIMTINSNKEM